LNTAKNVSTRSDSDNPFVVQVAYPYQSPQSAQKLTHNQRMQNQSFELGVQSADFEQPFFTPMKLNNSFHFGNSSLHHNP